MRRRYLIPMLLVLSWLATIYINAIITVLGISREYMDGSRNDPPSYSGSLRWINEGSNNNDGDGHGYGSGSGGEYWRLKVWKWRELLACESITLDMDDVYNYARESPSGVEMSLLTWPEMDYVYVAGISVGDAWGEYSEGSAGMLPVPEPLKVSGLERLILNLKVHEFRGAPLSPFIIPSWYALLTDVWFRVKNVSIDDGHSTEHYTDKVLGIDIFHNTMGGGLNILVMGMGYEYSRIEPCNMNFIYSINLASRGGIISIDLLELLSRAQYEAMKKGWYFSMDDVELVMVETVLEGYWAYAYARIDKPEILYELADGG